VADRYKGGTFGAAPQGLDKNRENNPMQSRLGSGPPRRFPHPYFDHHRIIHENNSLCIEL
jgi:hypothetical protein